MKADIKGMDSREMEAWVLSLGMEAYRARQIRQWVFKRPACSFEEMTDLPKAVRERLKEETNLSPLKKVKHLRSRDGTEKYLFRLPDGLSIESVLIPADEWETTLEYELEAQPRQVLLGFVLDSQSRLSGTARAILRQGDRVVGRVDRALSPVLESRALSPVRGPFENFVERGQAQVNYWRELGRAEEARGRALAQYATEQLIDTSVDTVSHDPRVQIFVQEFIQQQSLGIADEAIEEVRERTVSGDLLLERPVRWLFRRPPRESLPAPIELIRNLPTVGGKGRGR